MTDSQPKLRGASKTLLKTTAKYLVRMRGGERLMRDANGRILWATGKPAGSRTIRHMLETGLICPLDTDLFGDPSRGQTLGLVASKEH